MHDLVNKDYNQESELQKRKRKDVYQQNANKVQGDQQKNLMLIEFILNKLVHSIIYLFGAKNCNFMPSLCCL